MKQLSEVESLKFVVSKFRASNNENRCNGCGAFGQYWTLHVMKSDCSQFFSLVLTSSINGWDVVKITGTIQFGPSNFVTFKHDFRKESSGWSSGEIIANSDLSKYVERGEWSFHVHMQKVVDKKDEWSPKPLEKNPIYGKELLETPLGSEDISFLIGEEKQKFHAHKCIVLHRAPALYALVQDSHSAEVEIPAFTGSTFKTLLNYIYIGDVPKCDDVEAVKALLKAADCFGCTILKIHLEYEIVSSMMTAANAADWFLFADGLTCPLIREGFMYFYEENPNDVMASPAWKDIKESADVVVELLEFLAGKNRFPTAKDDYDNLPLYWLLKQLESLGLEIDGTRAMIVKRLKEYDAAIIAAHNAKNEQQDYERIQYEFD